MISNSSWPHKAKYHVFSFSLNSTLFLFTATILKWQHSHQILSMVFSSVQSCSHVQLFATPWIAAHQASMSITNSWSLLKHMSIKSVMPSSVIPFSSCLQTFPASGLHQCSLQLPQSWMFICMILHREDWSHTYTCRWYSGKESACQCRRHRRHGFKAQAGKIPWRRKWQPTPVFLPGKSHRQRSLGRLQSMGLQRIGHNLVTTHTTYIHTKTLYLYR